MMHLDNPEWLFPISLQAAKISQEQMAERVIKHDDFKHLSYVAGMDVSNNLKDPEQKIFAAAVVLSYSTLNVVETAIAQTKQEFPYIPGFLGFREAPVLVDSFKKLSIRPDLIMVDGHGISHPRSLGIASQLGVLLDIPTIGVAKTILIGSLKGILGEEVGCQVPLVWKNEVIAQALRTKKGCLPLIISTGHKISLEKAVKIVKSSLKGYRLSEPTRQAHLAANKYRLSETFP